MIKYAEPGVGYTLTFTQETCDRLRLISDVARLDDAGIANGVAISFMAAIIKIVQNGGTVVIDAAEMQSIVDTIEIGPVQNINQNSPAAKGSN